MEVLWEGGPRPAHSTEPKVEGWTGAGSTYPFIRRAIAAPLAYSMPVAAAKMTPKPSARLHMLRVEHLHVTSQSLQNLGSFL